jgi:spore coat polysaccharide biosynthesis protein SpsF
MGGSGLTVGAVVQARMGSTRLPGKVFFKIGGRPLLDHVLTRLARLRHEHVAIVATSLSPQDDVIAHFCADRPVTCFRGSESDVLSRYAECARAFGLCHVVRLTADNPFTDIDELDRLVALHLESGADYTHSFGMMPLGVGAEIFRREALDRSDRDGRAANHREHVNEYIQENPELFRIVRLEVPETKCCPDLRLSVDTLPDYERARRLVESAAGGWVTTEEAIDKCTGSA